MNEKKATAVNSETAGAANGKGARGPVAANDAVLGQVVWLMMQMPAFRHVFLADLEWMVMPSILLNQYRLFRADGRIVAVAAWAYLSPEAETRLQEPNARLAPNEWKSGDRLWLINLFAPFGHTEAALADLRQTALAGKTFKMHRWGPQGRSVVEMAGEGVALGSAH